jgi:hypothetical protein
MLSEAIGTAFPKMAKKVRRGGLSELVLIRGLHQKVAKHASEKSGATAFCRAFSPATPHDRTKCEFNGKVLVDEIRKFVDVLLVDLAAAGLPILDKPLFFANC